MSGEADPYRSWEHLVDELEEESRSAGKAKAAILKTAVEKAMAEAEALSAPPEVINRLDGILITLIEAGRDACTNEKCPHYGKKCKMR